MQLRRIIVREIVKSNESQDFNWFSLTDDTEVRRCKLYVVIGRRRWHVLGQDGSTHVQEYEKHQDGNQQGAADSEGRERTLIMI